MTGTGSPPFSSNARAAEVCRLLSVDMSDRDRWLVKEAIRRAYDAGCAKGRRVRVAARPHG